MKTLLSTITLSVLSSSSIAAPLTITPFYTNADSFHVTATLISGEHEAILVNGFFHRADALRAAAQILDSGKTLKTIVVSHGDPDFYFGLDVLTQLFPNAKVVATPATIAHIQHTAPLKQQYWSPKMGNNAPQRIIIPSPISTPLQIDGESIELKGQGTKTYLWIPSVAAIVGGIAVFDDMHVWMADDPKPQDWQAWQKTLTEIKALHPNIVIAGHSPVQTTLHADAVDFSANYLTRYQQAAQQSPDAHTLIERMQHTYPSLTGVDILGLGAKVVKGEIPWP